MAILKPFPGRILCAMMVLVTFSRPYGSPARGEMEEDDKKIIYRTVPGQKNREKAQESEELNQELSRDLLQNLTIDIENRKPPRRHMKDPDH